MSQPQGNDPIGNVPPPGPLVTVDFKEPRSKMILERVRQRVAMLGDSGRAITRATDAVQTADRLIGPGPGAMGAEFRPNGRRVLRLNEIAEDEPLWIIGDVRGDVLALETTLGFIDEATEKNRSPQIVFLGDLTGGMMGDAACLAIALERFAAAPTRTIVLAGDRELALCANSADAVDDRKPRGLAEMPVQPAQVKALENLVRAFSSLVEKLPVAAICPGGILLAHSAPPRASILSTLHNADELEAQPDVLRAFTFDRLHAREPRVISSALHGATPAESDDFSESMSALNRIFGMPVTRMVRGQDAAPEGHRWFRNYGEGVVLTLTTMGDVLTNDAGGGRRNPCVARLKSGRLRVVRFEIPEDIALTAEQIFPRKVAAAARENAVTTPESRSNVSEMHKPLMNTTTASTHSAKSAAPVVDPQAAQIYFERGVRLLSSRAWPGARQAFQEAATATTDLNACVLNEAVACLSMGLPGHQDALRLCRGLLLKNSANAHAHFNMGVSYLTSERNPIEAGRAFRTVTQLLPQFSDGWWALGLAFSLRADRRSAEEAFAKAAECGSMLARPNSMEGIIPARELAAMFEVLRGRAQYHPTLSSEPAPLADA